MPISWTAALRVYGKQKGHFILPRKGSPEYEAVKKIQNETEHSPEHEVKKRASKKSKKEVIVMEAHEPTTKAKKAPTRKGGAAPEVTRNHDPILPPASGTKPLESAGGAGSKAQMLKEEPVVKDEVKKVAKKKGVKASGLTAGAETVKNLTDSNLMDGGAAAAQLPGQVERIKKSMKKKEGEVKVVEVGNGEEKTLEGLKSDDPEAVSGRKPFSFQALRNQLLC